MASKTVTTHVQKYTRLGGATAYQVEVHVNGVCVHRERNFDTRASATKFASFKKQQVEQDIKSAR